MIWICYCILGGLFALFAFESGIGFDVEALADAEASREQLEVAEAHRVLIRWGVALTLAATWPVFLVAMLLPDDKL